MQEYTEDIFKFIAEITKRGVHIEFISTKDDEDDAFLKIHIYKKIPNSDNLFGKGIFIHQDQFKDADIGKRETQRYIMLSVETVESGFEKGDYANMYPAKEKTDDKRDDR